MSLNKQEYEDSIIQQFRTMNSIHAVVESVVNSDRQLLADIEELGTEIGEALAKWNDLQSPKHNLVWISKKAEDSWRSLVSQLGFKALNEALGAPESGYTG